MKFGKIVLLVSFLAIFCFLFSFGLPKVNAQTAEEILRRITELQTEISRLQKQLFELQVKPPTETPTELPKAPSIWCHDFNINLRRGNIGPEVMALQIALEKEGFEINKEEKAQNFFGDSTASSTLRFQEKYKEDILAPLGLERGTAFAGINTRKKLNELYGCKISIKPEKYIELISPNGGEEWAVGNTYKIKWEFKGLEPDKADIELWDYSTSEIKLLYSIASGIPASVGEYSWKIPEEIPPGEKYKMVIQASEARPPSWLDLSEGYFSIKGGKIPVAKNSITIFTPWGGKYTRGIDLSIHWSSSGPIEKVKITILKNHQLYCKPSGICLESIVTANTGSYYWKIPDDIEIGNDYSIKIEDANDPSVYKESPYFSIIIPTGPVGLEYIKNLLSSIADVVSQLIEKFK